MKENSDQIILTIEDNGIGIPSKDVRRVFEKGFTGENGRKFTKSTGMGLYLCYKLCKKLGLGINLESEENVGTKVKSYNVNGSCFGGNEYGKNEEIFRKII